MAHWRHGPNDPTICAHGRSRHLEVMMDDQTIHDAVVAFRRGDTSPVEALIAALQPCDRRDRIMAIAGFCYEFREQVGDEGKAIEELDALYHLRLGNGLPEYRTVVLGMIAEAGHAAGHPETAASFGLGAIRAALEDMPETPNVASNTMRRFQKQGIV